MSERLLVEVEQDGRWIAEVSALAGVLAYGATQDEAIKRAEALALRVIADRSQRAEDRGEPVSKVERLEAQIRLLTPGELAEFRSWYEKFDCGAWDTQVASDVEDGRLDALADAALREHVRGETMPL
ncbi:MAG: hypothetical protein U0842_22710 [Candidatus Binatia bacterium]|jgi:predicted RNase H-like HicB family nuclease